MGPIKLTRLNAISSRRGVPTPLMAKTHNFDKEGELISTDEYDKGYLFNSSNVVLADLKEFHEFLLYLSGEQTTALILNRAEENHDEITRKAVNFQITDTRILALDIDEAKDARNIQDIEDLVISWFPELAGCSYIFQHSNSSMLEGYVKGHMFFVLEDEVKTSQLKDWLAVKNLEYREKTGKSRLVDPAFYHNVQLIYTAKPRIKRDGVLQSEDVMERRYELITKDRDAVPPFEIPEYVKVPTTTNPVRVNTPSEVKNALINEVAVGMNLRRDELRDFGLLLTGMGFSKEDFLAFAANAVDCTSSANKLREQENIWDFIKDKGYYSYRKLLDFVTKHNPHALEEYLPDIRDIGKGDSTVTQISETRDSSFLPLAKAEAKLKTAMKEAFEDDSDIHHLIRVPPGLGKSREVAIQSKLTDKRVLILGDKHALLSQYSAHLPNALHVRGKTHFCQAEFDALRAKLEAANIRVNDSYLSSLFSSEEYDDQFEGIEDFRIALAPHNYLLQPGRLAKFKPDLIVVDENAMQQFSQRTLILRKKNPTRKVDIALNAVLEAVNNTDGSFKKISEAIHGKVSNKDGSCTNTNVPALLQEAMEENQILKNSEESKAARKAITEELESIFDGETSMFELYKKYADLRQRLTENSPKHQRLIEDLLNGNYDSLPNKFHFIESEGFVKGFYYLTHKKLPKAWKGVKIIMVDATADTEILEKLTGLYFNCVHLKVNKHTDKEVIQVISNNFSKNWISRNMDRCKEFRDRMSDSIHFGYKQFEEELKLHGYHGNTRGMNSYENASSMVIWGRNTPPADALLLEAKAIYCEDEELIEVEQEKLPIRYYTAKGTYEGLRYGYTDPRLQRVSNFIEAETYQTVERARTIRPGKMTVYILTNLPMPMVVSKLVNHNTLFDNKTKQKARRFKNNALDLLVQDLQGQSKILVASNFPSLNASQMKTVQQYAKTTGLEGIRHGTVEITGNKLPKLWVSEDTGSLIDIKKTLQAASKKRIVKIIER